MADDPRSGPEVAVVGSANLDLVVEVETIPVAGEAVLVGCFEVGDPVTDPHKRSPLCTRRAALRGRAQYGAFLQSDRSGDAVGVEVCAAPGAGQRP